MLTIVCLGKTQVQLKRINGFILHKAETDDLSELLKHEETIIKEKKKKKYLGKINYKVPDVGS